MKAQKPKEPQHYIQVFIKDESNLPEKGRYIGKDKQTNKIFEDWEYDESKEAKAVWLACVDWYLKPEEPAKGLTNEDIEKRANEYVIPDTIPTNAAFIGFKDGAKWARSRMQSDLREELIKFFNQFDRDFLYSDLSTEYIIDEYLNSKRKIR